MSRRAALVTQCEIRRAVKEAQKAQPPMAVEILPGGTIRLTPAVSRPVDDSGGPPKPKKRIML